MKQYLKLSSLSDAITAIIPFKNSKKAAKVKKEFSFVVLNSDNDYGFYVKRFVKEINRFQQLVEQPKALRVCSLKNIKTGDLIVFGDCLGNIDYDYRVELDPRELDHLDGRSVKVYDLISDFQKIIRRLHNYVEANETKKVVYKRKPKQEKEVVDIEINLNLTRRYPKSKVPYAILTNHLCTEEKVTIFHNWVKVGYNQYDIFVDFNGREYVYIDGHKFQIKEDRWGRRYLSS